MRDGGPSEDRVLISGLRRNMELLKSAVYWRADGAVKVRNPLLSTYGIANGFAAPCVYALLPNNNENA